MIAFVQFTLLLAIAVLVAILLAVHRTATKRLEEQLKAERARRSNTTFPPQQAEPKREPTMNKKHILVIGAGVSGLSTALNLLQSGHNVTIWSKEKDGEFPHTSFNAYAMWWPVAIDSDPRVERWANETFAALELLSHDTATGIVMRRVMALKQKREEPWYAAKLPVFRHARPNELTGQYEDAHVLDTAPVIDPTVFLPWLRRQVLALGGRIEQHEVTELANFPAQFSAVVNCTALGSRQLVGDAGLFPSRLQVVKIKNHGFDRVVFDDEGPNRLACIVPHADYIKLGAIYDEHNESLEVDAALVQDILERCKRMAPELKAELSDVISVTRALRPERSSPRVEATQMSDGRLLVHNYGHDGMGYILSLGIAAEVAGYVNA